MSEAPTRRIQPVTLNGEHVALQPLSFEHEAGLAAAVQDGALWELWFTSVPRPENMKAEIERRVVAKMKGWANPDG